MQLTDRPQTQSPTAISFSTARPTSPKLYMQWELVDGKLACRWLQQPD